MQPQSEQERDPSQHLDLFTSVHWALRENLKKKKKKRVYKK